MASYYRPIVREAARSSLKPRVTRNPVVSASFRQIFDKQRTDPSPDFEHDIQNATTFMTSQRMHKILLDRYNPTRDLTTEERVKATAHRVGLNMPLGPKPDGDKE